MLDGGPPGIEEAPMHPGDRRAHVGIVATGALLVAACALGPAWRYAAVSVATLLPLAVLVLQLPRRHGPTRAGWVLMAGGTAVLAVHNVQNQVALAGTGSPAVGAFSGTTLALGYALLVVGGGLTAARYAGADRGGMLDAAVIGLAAANLLWGLVLYPAHVRRGSGPATLLYEMALVLLVAALAGVILRMAVVVRPMRTAALHLALAIGASIAADVAFTFTEDPVTHLATPWASVLCTVALVAFAAALAHPSSAAAPDPGPETVGLTRRRLTFLGAALATTPALVVVLQLTGGPIDPTLVGAGSLLMVPLVVARLAQLARRTAEAERHLRHLASHDELTGLPNRRTMQQHLESLLGRSTAGASPGVVVLYIDLDDFKVVNDTHGHVVGDQLLRIVGSRIRASVRPQDMVARFGGDEFVVLLEGDRAAGVDVGRRVEAALALPVAVGAVRASGRASIGIAVATPGQRIDAERLVERADAEMYCAKRARPGRADPEPILPPEASPRLWS